MMLTIGRWRWAKFFRPLLHAFVEVIGPIDVQSQEMVYLGIYIAYIPAQTQKLDNNKTTSSYGKLWLTPIDKDMAISHDTPQHDLHMTRKRKPNALEWYSAEIMRLLLSVGVCKEVCWLYKLSQSEHNFGYNWRKYNTNPEGVGLLTPLDLCYFRLLTDHKHIGN